MPRHHGWKLSGVIACGLGSFCSAAELSDFAIASSSACIESTVVEDGLTGGSSQGSCADFDRCCSEPTWAVRAEALLWHRSNPGTSSAPPDYLNATKASAFGLDTTNGWDLAVRRQHVADTAWAVEGVFFALDSRSSTAGSFPLTNMGTWNAAPYDYTGNYASSLRNVELNAWREVNDWLTLLVGARYLNLHEDLDIGQTMHYSPSFQTTATWQFATTNDLFGVQFGLDSHLWSSGRFSVDGVLKAGIFNNSATGQGASQLPWTPPCDASAATNHTAFVGETALAASYEVLNSWSVRAGYQVLWLEGVALATGQEAALVAGGSPTVSTEGCPFYHGALVGLEFSR